MPVLLKKMRRKYQQATHKYKKYCQRDHFKSLHSLAIKEIKN